MSGENNSERPDLRSIPVTPEDYDALYQEAQEHNHETFEDRAARAEREGDPEFASDLRLTGRIAESLKQDGALALVVGGYARDEALSRIKGEPQKSKDIDVEVYRMEFDDMAEYLKQFGDVLLVGEAFSIAKVKNPETGHVLDFSIPRRDSKVDKGHKGFEVTGDPNMSVAEAARRRDLTINALALNPLSGELIDEYGGLEDLKAGVLRATDYELFADDELRALRVMQFKGRFNFEVEDQTEALIRTLDLTELSRERIGEEWVKLMMKSEKPSVGIEWAQEVGILRQLHPELYRLEAVEQEPDWHPEGNVLKHSMYAADAAAWALRQPEQADLTEQERTVVMFGALSHDFGKATTTERQMKRDPDDGIEKMRITAHGHEQAGVEPARVFLEGLKLGAPVIDRILPIINDHLWHVHIKGDPKDRQIRRFAGRLMPANIRLWDLISRSDSNGRTNNPDEYQEQTGSYRVYEKSKGLRVSEGSLERVLKGPDIEGPLAHILPDRGNKREYGLALGAVLNFMYEQQVERDYRTVEDGILLALAHPKDLREAIERRLEEVKAMQRDQEAKREATKLAAQQKPRSVRQAEALAAHERGLEKKRLLAEAQARNAERKAQRLLEERDQDQ